MKRGQLGAQMAGHVHNVLAGKEGRFGINTDHGLTGQSLV
jgi:hypothetical protein